MIEWAREILEREEKNGLYGAITFSFQNGKIVACKTEKSEKPPK